MPTDKIFLLHCHAEDDRTVLVTAQNRVEALQCLGIAPTGMAARLWETFQVPREAIQELLSGETQRVDLRLICSERPSHHRFSSRWSQPRQTCPCDDEGWPCE